MEEAYTAEHVISSTEQSLRNLGLDTIDVQQFHVWFDISIDTTPEIALRYVLSHPAVSTVIPGMRSVRNVENNMRVGDGLGLSKEQVEKLKPQRWIRNFYRG